VKKGKYYESSETGTMHELGNVQHAAQAAHALTLVRNQLHARPRQTAKIVIADDDAADAGTAVAAIQIFTDAIETIAEKLAKMLELARKALGPYCSQVQAEEMQNQFRNLARQINQIANNTERELSRPFSGNGESLSISIDDGSKIDIPARDFRMDVRQLDIETDPQNALSKVKEAIRNINHYKTYLDRQDARAREITAAIELQIQDAMGVDMQDFQPELAAPMADYAASLILQDKQTSIHMQANLTCDEILKLLKNKA
jgi:flagellin-like hook-associated protein FlgL